jgi:cytochrome P450
MPDDASVMEELQETPAETTDPTEVVTDEPEGTEPEGDTPETSPAISPEEAAKVLGLDADALTKIRNLSDWEKRVNRESTELGLMRQQMAQLQAQAPAPASDEDELDAESMALLTKAVGKVMGVDPAEVGSVIREVRQNAVESVDVALTEFLSSHPDVSYDDLFGRIAEMGAATPRNGAQARSILDVAYKSLRADRELTDDALSALVEKKAKELLESKVKTGEEVTAVRPSRTAKKSSTTDDPMADATGENLWEKLRGE